MCTMPRPYPREFREDVIRVARSREPGVRLRDIADDFGISESCLVGWLKRADVENGIRPGVTEAEHAENREWRKRLRLLEQETRCCAERRRICRRRTCRENDVPARP
jgi:transposase-like protein